MATPDARIPLQVQQRDFSAPLTRLNEQAREDKLIAQQQGRQATLDASTLKTQELSQTRAQQQIDATSQEQQTATIRKIAMDSLATIELLKANQTSEAGRLMISNIDKMTELGMDTSKALRFARLAANDPQAAIKFGEEQMIPTIQATMPDLFPKEEFLTESQVITAPGGQIGTATASEGFTPLQGAPDPTTEEKRTIVQIMRAGGGIDQGFTDGQGSFFNNQNEPIVLAEGDRAITASLTGGADQLGLNDADLSKLADAEVAAKTFIATAGDALNLLSTTPDVNTFIAGAASVVNDLQQEAKAIGRAFNVDIDENLLEPETYSDDFWNDLGIQNARMKSLVTSLAFQAAAASGQTGRGVSDRDVRRFIEEIGANSSDPVAFATTIRDVADRVDRGFRINFSTRARSDFEGDLGLEALDRIGQAQEQDLTTLSDIDLVNF